MIDSKYWKNKNVLVTGSTGFLGGWLIAKLLDLETNVIAIVHRPKPLSQFYLKHLDKSCTVEVGSVYDQRLIDKIFSENHIDVLFHAAYGADVHRVMTEPLECFRSNAESTWRLLETIRNRAPECISVIVSSDKVYGRQDIPFHEDQKLNPIHPYEVAKTTQDYTAQSYGKTYGIPVAISRCANFFGPYDFNFTRLIPGILKDLVLGNDVVLRSDGKFTRNFLYMLDAVDAHLLLAQKVATNDKLYGEAFNFSYENRTVIIDIVNDIIRLSNKSAVPVIQNNITNEEIRDLHLSSRKALDVLNWVPRIGYDKGLEKTVSWYLDFFKKNPTYTSKI